MDMHMIKYSIILFFNSLVQFGYDEFEQKVELPCMHRTKFMQHYSWIYTRMLRRRRDWNIKWRYLN